MAATGEFQPVRDNTTGDLFLPASRRPDGTWRKPRRVKEGYVPQEEVPVYESKGKQWAKSLPAYPVGMNPALAAAQSAAQNKSKKGDQPLIPGLPPAAQQVAKKKKKKSKPEVEVKEVTGKLAGFTIQEPNFGVPARASKEPTKTPVESSTAPPSSVTDPAKRLKNLKKKLKDIEALEAKVKSGELKNPDKDQTEKIKRKKEVIKEIKEMENSIK